MFSEGDAVFLRSAGGHEWVPAVVVACTGSQMYLCRTEEGVKLRRHVDDLRKRYCGVDVSESGPKSGQAESGQACVPEQQRDSENLDTRPSYPQRHGMVTEEEQNLTRAGVLTGQEECDDGVVGKTEQEEAEIDCSTQLTENSAPPILRRSQRTRRAPEKLDL